jgi:hypothetical protein
MQFKEIFAVYSENHVKYINALCWKIAELLDVQEGGVKRYHCSLKR